MGSLLFLFLNTYLPSLYITFADINTFNASYTLLFILLSSFYSSSYSNELKHYFYKILLATSLYVIPFEFSTISLTIIDKSFKPLFTIISLP